MRLWKLYKQLAASMRELLNQGRIPALRDRKIALVCVLWPSKKFADEQGNVEEPRVWGRPSRPSP